MTSEVAEKTESSKDILKKLLGDSSFTTNWVALEFEKNEIKVLGSGEGGILEGYDCLKDDVAFLLVRGCHKRMKIIQKILVLVLYIPKEVSGFRSAKAAYQVDVLSKKLEMGHFCLIDTRIDDNLSLEAVTKRVKDTIGSPGKYILDQTSNTVLREHYEEQERKKEKPQSEKKKQTESNVFKEILETEETYVRSLNLFVSSYITPLKDIVPDFYRSLFTLISIIININEEFLEKLQKTKGFTSGTEEAKPVEKEKTKEISLDDWGEDDVKKPEEESKPEEEESEGEKDVEENQHKKNVALMVEILVSQCPVFKLYLPYVNEYTKLLAKVNHLMQKDSKFKDFCNKKKSELQKQKERCTDIYGFLIMPIQRIPRYQLLMRDLLKQTHPKDPNFPKIKEGLDKTLELAQYVNTKKAEAVMSVKTISISQKYKMNDLMDLKRRMIKYSEDCTIQKKPGEVCVFTDLLLLIPSGKKKVFRISLSDPDVRVYDSSTAASQAKGDGKKKSSHQIDDSAFVVETQRKKHVIGFKDKNNAESFIQLIQTRLNVNLGQAAMDQKLAAHIIYKSFLQKKGGKRYTSSKKRWHELTADMKMKYYDKPLGKMKGSYSIFGATAGKGNARKKKDHDKDDDAGVSAGDKYSFYIKTSKRTFQVFANNVEILDTWIRILEMVGLKREDFIDMETEKQHQKELEDLYKERNLKYELTELRARQAEEEARQEKLKEENYRKMFLKLNSMIRNMPIGEGEEEGEEDDESSDDEEDEGEGAEKKTEGVEQEKDQEENKKEEEETAEPSESEDKPKEEGESTTTATTTTPEEGEGAEKKTEGVEQEKDQEENKKEEEETAEPSESEDKPKEEGESTTTATTTTPEEKKEEEEVAAEETKKKLPKPQSLPSGTVKNKKPPPVPVKRGQRGPPSRGPLPKRSNRGRGRGRGRDRRGAVGGRRGRPGPSKNNKGGNRYFSMKTRVKPLRINMKNATPKSKDTSDVNEEERIHQQRMEVLKKKNLIHTELRVRRRSVIRSQKLIEKIRLKKVAAPPVDEEKKEAVEEEKEVPAKKEEVEEEEKKEKVSEEGEKTEDSEGIKIAEKVIERKSDLHTELLMKKKKKNLFKKGWFKKKKKKKDGSTTPNSPEKEETDPKKKKGFLKKLPVWKAKKNMENELKEKKKQGRLKPPPRSGRPRPPKAGTRPVTHGSVSQRLKGLKGLQDSIKGVGEVEDEGEEVGGKEVSSNRRPVPRNRRPVNEPWKNKQRVNKELLFMKKMMVKSAGIAPKEQAKGVKTKIEEKDFSQYSSEVQEILKKERMEWKNEVIEMIEVERKKWREEELPSILEEEKKKIREEVLKEMNQK